MARTPSLPERLRYLQPFRIKFAKHPDDLNEDTGGEKLFALLRKRIKGLSDEAAEKLLLDDAVALGDWLELPEQENDPLQFAGVMMGPDLVPSILGHIREEERTAKEPFPWVLMELPPKAKVRRFEKHREGGMLIRWGGYLIGVGHLTEKAYEKLYELKSRCSPGVSVAESKVQFGEVSGTKFVRVIDTVRGDSKEIVYFLKVTGEYVEASVSVISAKGDQVNWDESAVEALFHTIRVVSSKDK